MRALSNQALDISSEEVPPPIQAPYSSVHLMISEGPFRLNCAILLTLELGHYFFSSENPSKLISSILPLHSPLTYGSSVS